MYPYLAIEAQELWHSSVEFVGDREALHSLIAQVNDAMLRKVSSPTMYHNGKVEYRLQVIVDPAKTTSERWLQLALPYTVMTSKNLLSKHVLTPRDFLHAVQENSKGQDLKLNIVFRILLAPVGDVRVVPVHDVLHVYAPGTYEEQGWIIANTEGGQLLLQTIQNALECGKGENTFFPMDRESYELFVLLRE